jgi:hypothetical protein
LKETAMPFAADTDTLVFYAVTCVCALLMLAL